MRKSVHVVFKFFEVDVWNRFDHLFFDDGDESLDFGVESEFFFVLDECHRTVVLVHSVQYWVSWTDGNVVVEAS